MRNLAQNNSDSTLALGEPSSTTPLGADLLSIQYLRGVAAVGVLIFHAADRTGASFSIGGAGVDVFFVISGLIMWMIGARRPLTPGSFLLRRVIRVVPLYWSVTLALVVIWLVLPSALPNLSPTPSHVLLSMLFVPHFDAAGDIVPLIVPGWTLNYEAFFYLLFALTLVLPIARRLWLLTLTLATLSLVGGVLNPADPILATFTDPLLLEFAAGAWIGKAFLEGRTPSPRFAIGLLVCGCAFLVAGELAAVDVGPWRVFLWGGPAVLIVAGMLGLEAAGLVPKLRLPKFIGDASYSIYLVHGLAVGFAVRAVGLLGFPLGNAFAFVCAVAAGLVAGAACFLVVERPLLRKLQRRQVASPLNDAIPR